MSAEMDPSSKTLALDAKLVALKYAIELLWFPKTYPTDWREFTFEYINYLLNALVTTVL